MKNLLYLIGILLIICLVGRVIFGVVYLKKKISYEWMYKSMVEQTVRDMVKQEALKQ